MKAKPRLYVSSGTSTRKRGVKKVTCSRCENKLEPSRIVAKQSYCKACHAEYMRLHRPKHSELKPEAKMKANARAYANVYERRGQLEKQPCEKCGNKKSQKHHEDHTKPLEVTWFCRPCHLEFHRVQNGKVHATT